MVLRLAGIEVARRRYVVPHHSDCSRFSFEVPHPSGVAGRGAPEVLRSHVQMIGVFRIWLSLVAVNIKELAKSYEGDGLSRLPSFFDSRRLCAEPSSNTGVKENATDPRRSGSALASDQCIESEPDLDAFNVHRPSFIINPDDVLSSQIDSVLKCEKLLEAIQACLRIFLLPAALSLCIRSGLLYGRVKVTQRSSRRRQIINDFLSSIPCACSVRAPRVFGVAHYGLPFGPIRRDEIAEFNGANSWY